MLNKSHHYCFRKKKEEQSWIKKLDVSFSIKFETKKKIVKKFFNFFLKDLQTTKSIGLSLCKKVEKKKRSSISWTNTKTTKAAYIYN